MESMA